ncbi:MAG: hypothetical protein KME27_26310 [Lyngbya sp. HA4199-MV5]|jgi:hypothetical protein|nr:hypothetical protein [Lyngbya sp. HA4199-MV5]
MPLSLSFTMSFISASGITFLALSLLLVDEFILRPLQEIQQIRQHKILQVGAGGNLLLELKRRQHSSGKRYSNELLLSAAKLDKQRFPLGRLAVLEGIRYIEKTPQSKALCYAEIVFPALDNDGKLHYEYWLCDLVELWYPRLLLDRWLHCAHALEQHPSTTLHSELFTPSWHKLSLSDKLRYKSAREQVAPFVRQHFQLLKEDHKYLQQRHEILQLLGLMMTSETYASHKRSYEMALSRLNELHCKSLELDQLYRRVISDLLIGIELATHNPNLISDDHVSIQAQYETQFKVLKEEYQYIKDVSTASANLLATE